MSYYDEDQLAARKGKASFKQYLQDIRDDESDEFGDIPDLRKSDISKKDGKRIIRFGAHEHDFLELSDQDFEEIKVYLKKDDSTIIKDQDDSSWSVQRTLDDLIVFENEESGLAGKYSYPQLIKLLT